MCFSAEADLAAAAVLAPVGVVTLRAARRREELLVASLPLLFAAHQFTEAFVWLGVDGDVSAAVQRAAIVAYLAFAQVVLPVFVPVAFLVLEPPGVRRRLMTALLGVGVLVAARFTWILATNPAGVSALDHLLVYDTDWEFGYTVAAAYVVATCGPPLLSSRPLLRWLGAANLVGLAVAAAVRYEAVTSVWCVYAAFASILVLISLRRDAGPAGAAA